VIGLAQAAAIRGAVRTALVASDETIMDPAPLFGSLNAMLAASATRQVVSCTYVGVDLASGRMAYINAGGMPPLLMVAAGRLITLDQPSLVLGVDASYTYQTSTVDFPEPFRLVCFSDGLVEATNSSGDAVGSEHIHEALLQPEAFAAPDAAIEALSKLLTTHLAGIEQDGSA
jgi:serine phosphatase RsbU (regulator of sigma subunit)